MSLEKLKEKRKELDRRHNELTINIKNLSDESYRVYGIANKSREIISDIEDEFELQTGLDKLDITFLFFATALQCCRQYLITDFKERVDDKTVANKVKGGIKEHTNRSHRWYKPSLEEIITNPVPFDAMFGSKDFKLGIGGGFGHRAKTLGHDPLLGWIFGTANIATSTLTTWSFDTYHVKTGYIKNGQARDKISNKAKTMKMFEYTTDKLLNEGINGKIIIAVSLIKEYIHLRSDIQSIVGLPLPIISTISPEYARIVADYGIDMTNIETIGKQASYSIFINVIIAMLHRMLYNEEKHGDISLYEVKTRKILSYSNLIASSSNIIYVTINAQLGNESAIRKLDLGGILVTIYRIITDSKFIYDIKEEFVFGEFSKIIKGN